jgi:hypothetical protein
MPKTVKVPNALVPPVSAIVTAYKAEQVKLAAANAEIKVLKKKEG